MPLRNAAAASTASASSAATASGAFAANCSDSSATRPARSAPPAYRRPQLRPVSRRAPWPAVRPAGQRRRQARRAGWPACPAHVLPALNFGELLHRQRRDLAVGFAVHAGLGAGRDRLEEFGARSAGVDRLVGKRGRAQFGQPGAQLLDVIVTGQSARVAVSWSRVLCSSRRR